MEVSLERLLKSAYVPFIQRVVLPDAKKRLHEADPLALSKLAQFMQKIDALQPRTRVISGITANGLNKKAFLLHTEFDLGMKLSYFVKRTAKGKDFRATSKVHKQLASLNSSLQIVNPIYADHDEHIHIFPFIEGTDIKDNPSREMEFLENYLELFSQMQLLEFPKRYGDFTTFFSKNYSKKLATDYAPLGKVLTEALKWNIHGDLHARNVLDTGDNFAVIDWERASVGFLEIDLSSYVTKLSLDESDAKNVIDRFYQHKDQGTAFNRFILYQSTYELLSSVRYLKRSKDENFKQMANFFHNSALRRLKEHGYTSFATKVEEHRPHPNVLFTVSDEAYRKLKKEAYPHHVMSQEHLEQVAVPKLEDSFDKITVGFSKLQKKKRRNKLLAGLLLTGVLLGSVGYTLKTKEEEKQLALKRQNFDSKQVHWYRNHFTLTYKYFMQEHYMKEPAKGLINDELIKKTAAKYDLEYGFAMNILNTNAVASGLQLDNHFYLGIFDIKTTEAEVAKKYWTYEAKLISPEENLDNGMKRLRACLDKYSALSEKEQEVRALCDFYTIVDSSMKNEQTQKFLGELISSCRFGVETNMYGLSSFTFMDQETYSIIQDHFAD